MKYINIIKQILAIIGIVFILLELFYNLYEKPREEKLVNDAKLLTLFMLTQDFEKDDQIDDFPYANYGETS